MEKSNKTYFDMKEHKEKAYGGFVVKVELDSEQLMECLAESCDLPSNFRDKYPSINRLICECISCAREQAPRDKE